LEAQGVEVGEFRVFRDGTRLVERAAEIARSGQPAVAVGGGDGTVGAVAGRLAGTGCALGLIPAGTGNAFARDLGMNGSLEQAAAWIAGGQARSVDLAEVGGMPCVNVATLGLSTLVARFLDPTLKRHLGKAAYALAVVRAVRGVNPVWVRIEAERTSVEALTLQVVVANGRTHGGPFVVTPRATLDSGTLSVYAVQTGDKRALVRYALTIAFRGAHVALPEVWSAETPAVRIESDPPARATVDGEPGPRSPFEASSLPAALRVLAPDS
jgi:YegS/Rv2252/BmrU family lipid kinase